MGQRRCLPGNLRTEKVNVASISFNVNRNARRCIGDFSVYPAFFCQLVYKRSEPDTLNDAADFYLFCDDFVYHE